MNDRGHLSGPTLDLLRLGHAPEGARDHLGACADCAARCAELERDAAEFAARSRPMPRLPLRQRSLWMGAGMALAACAFLYMRLSDRLGPDVRVKGGPVLQVYGLHGGRVRTLHGGDRVAAGDRLRFRAEPAGRRYLLLVSRDGTGAVSPFYPVGGAASAPLPDAPGELPGSIELDAAPGPEHLFALFSDKPLRVEDVTAALQAGRALPDAAVVELLLEKQAP